MRGLSIASLVLSILGLGCLIVALFVPAGSMTGAQSDCQGSETDCFTHHERVTWSMYRESRSWEREENGTATADETSRTWQTLRQKGVSGAAEASLAGTLVWSSFGLGILGLILVLVGRYTHPAVGIIGGVVNILVLPAAAATGIVLWAGISGAGSAFKKEIVDATLDWATNGPWPGLGLIFLGAGAALFLVGGILGLMPGGYRR